ncbi:glycosyltransferase family 2 protein [Verrucomicrobiaceae bacterium 5K15]|uniref:Glycosyltransferase family 2 protein n=1 Tax=Oceaniferula flava TaxID=2800421 RepID=A0AAE2VDZ0_9BACT|nr:glycosyltransferase family 2 protein [Oceaniferula flavus]MBK1856511.1 glycosyltransferase family 2 protein [Oceaniferula flavus]MBM1137818.1 glycosyltransferase family 2 protein [Oceaniferula flavus]
MSYISVIIPNYNRGWCIEETIKSVVRVSDNILLEVLVVDNGSNDESKSVIDKLRSVDPRIKWIEASHLPQNGNCARNLGAEYSSGDYLQFLDSDDLIAYGKLESQLKLLQGGDVYDVATSGWSILDENGDCQNVKMKRHWHNYDNSLDLLVEMWSNSEWFFPGCWLISKELYEKVGKWTEDLQADQDGEFFARILLAGDKVHFDGERGFVRRKHSGDHVGNRGSISSVNSRFKAWDIIQQKLLDKENSRRVKVAISRRLHEVAYRCGTTENGWLRWASEKQKTIGINDFGLCKPYLLNIMTLLFGFEKGVNLRRRLLGSGR